MPDLRMTFVQSIEQNLVGILTPEQINAVTSKITIALENYEITERCTDLAPTEDLNEKILKRYLACLSVDGKSDKTIYQYKRTALRLADAINKNYTDMGIYDIRFFIASEKERGISNRSLENARANLSAFFQWMTDEEVIPKNPVSSLKPIKYKKEIKSAFSEVELDRMRSACKNSKERAIIELLISSGIRVAELCALTVSDIGYSTLDVHVRQGKGNKERMTYTTDMCVSHIKKYLDTRAEKDGTHLFYNKNHKPIGTGGVRAILKSIEKRAGIVNVHPHRFRRTFATKLANRGMEVQEIQRLLGHSKIDTTMTYICMNDDRVKSSYNKYIA